MGYANRGTVYRLVKNALEGRQVETIDELRRLEVDRLDALQVAIWDDATNGDVRAVAAVVRIMHLRAKILGLYSHTHSNCPHGAKPRSSGDGGARCLLSVACGGCCGTDHRPIRAMATACLSDRPPGDA